MYLQISREMPLAYFNLLAQRGSGSGIPTVICRVAALPKNALKPGGTDRFAVDALDSNVTTFMCAPQSRKSGKGVTPIGVSHIVKREDRDGTAATSEPEQGSTSPQHNPSPHYATGFGSILLRRCRPACYCPERIGRNLAACLT